MKFEAELLCPNYTQEELIDKKIECNENIGSVISLKFGEGKKVYWQFLPVDSARRYIVTAIKLMKALEKDQFEQGLQLKKAAVDNFLDAINQRELERENAPERLLKGFSPIQIKWLEFIREINKNRGIRFGEPRSGLDTSPKMTLLFKSIEEYIIVKNKRRKRASTASSVNS